MSQARLLPLLEPHDATLQKCVYCPKLSRAACPVSNVEASETVTPWGKMSLAWFASRGDVPVDVEHAAPAWACSGCYGCRERCDHKNEVSTVLHDARAEMFQRGAAPEGARAVASATRVGERAADIAARAQALAAERPAPRTGGAALLVGCGYLRRAPEVARDIVALAEGLLGEVPRLVTGCCGLPQYGAGDRPGFEATARALLAELGGATRVLVADPGCARALLVDYPRVGVLPAVAEGGGRQGAIGMAASGGAPASTPRPELLLDLCASSSKIGASPRAPQGTVRWHDPCQLGRGLGRFDEPRALLRRILGRPPEEFLYQRELATCSGAGAILPATRPETSRGIADARIAEHRERGGGTLVTACASSLHRFRSRGEEAVDLHTLLAESLR
ncbi:MAG: (Fe-S)-binding protein [Polyangiaceae bacterium]